MCMNVLLECIKCPVCLFGVRGGVNEGANAPLERELQTAASRHAKPGTAPSPLQEQQVLSMRRLHASM